MWDEDIDITHPDLEVTVLTDTIARTIVTAGWANETFGSVQESGHFALITIDGQEALEVARMVDETLAQDFGNTTTIVGSDVIGNYIVREDDQGLVWVSAFPTKEEAKRMYDLMEAANARAWGSDGEEG